MKSDKEFKVEYDDQVFEVIAAISNILNSEFGIEIIETEEGDGYMKYLIEKIDDDT